MLGKEAVEWESKFGGGMLGFGWGMFGGKLWFILGGGIGRCMLGGAIFGGGIMCGGIFWGI